MRNAKLLAIEANPYLVPVLAKTVDNLRSYDDRGNNYEVQAIAISDAAGTAKLYVSTIPTLSSVFPYQSALAIDVPAAQLDDFYRPARTVIKIDIEGAEYRAIQSAVRFLHSRTTSFFVELHGWGDRIIRKYPIHVCWLFLMNGYATKKIGTHYFFYRASFPKRVISFGYRCPYLMLKYLVYRLGLNESMNELRNRWGNLAKHKVHARSNFR